MKERLIKIFSIFEEMLLLSIVLFLPMIFSFGQENFNIFELNKLVFFRVVLTIAFLFYLARFFLQKKYGKKIKFALFAFLALLSLSFFVSSCFSIHPELSFWGGYGRQQGFYSFIYYFLFFYLLIVSFYPEEKKLAGEKTRPRIKRFIWGMIFSSIPVCFYGLLQYFFLDPLDWEEKAIYTGRIFSTLGQPNFFAQYLIIVIPLTIFSLGFLQKRFFSRFLTVVLLFSQLVCLTFTYSRSAWLGLISSVIVFLFLFLWAKGFKKSFLILSALLLAMIFSAFSLGIFYSHRNFSLQEGITFSGRIKSAFDIRVGSNKIRLFYWQTSWEVFKESDWQRKLLGYGPETLQDVFVKYYRPDWGIYEKLNTFADRAHNAIFDTVLQFGLAGLALFISFLGYIFFAAFKYLKSSRRSEEYWLLIFLFSILSGYFVNSLFGFSLSVAYIYFYAILAIIFLISSSGGEDNLSDQKEKEKFFHPISLVFIWLAAFFFMGVLIYYYNIKPLVADYYYMRVKVAEAKRDCRKIFDNMEKTVAIYPGSTFYKEKYIYHNLNCFDSLITEEDKNNLRDNIISMINSIGPKEYDFYSWVNIAHAKSLFGYYFNQAYYRAAEEDYRRLLEINPFITATYQDLGRMKMWEKSYGEAMENFTKAINLFPDLNSPFLNNEHKGEIKTEEVSLLEMMGLTANYQKDWAKALEYYQWALELNPRYLRLYKEIADVYYQQGDLDKAIFYNKRGYKLNPQDYTWPLSLSLLYQERGDAEKARQYSAEADKLKSAD
jgi:O-antigen ligase